MMTDRGEAEVEGKSPALKSLCPRFTALELNLYYAEGNQLLTAYIESMKLRSGSSILYLSTCPIVWK
jgi:hypothetical protein